MAKQVAKKTTTSESNSKESNSKESDEISSLNTNNDECELEEPIITNWADDSEPQNDEHSGKKLEKHF